MVDVLLLRLPVHWSCCVERVFVHVCVCRVGKRESERENEDAAVEEETLRRRGKRETSGKVDVCVLFFFLPIVSFLKTGARRMN